MKRFVLFFNKFIQKNSDFNLIIKSDLSEKEKIIPFAEEEKNYTEAYNLSKVWLKGQLDYESIPGLTMSVVQNQRIDWSIALGISDDQTALKQSSLFSICSISKLFTSIPAIFPPCYQLFSYIV